MDHDVAVRHGLEAGGVETEAVGCYVTGDGGDPGGHLVVEPVAQLFTETVEAVVLDDLLGRPLQGRRTATRADQKDDLAVGDAAQNALHQGGTEESGGAGDEESPAGQGVTHAGHPICLPYGK